MKKYILLFLMSLAFFLISSLPASLFVSSIQSQSPYLNFTTVEGSIWQGHANSPKLGKIDWDFSPLALLQAKLGWQIQIEQEAQYALVFNLSVDVFKQLQLSEVAGTLSSIALKNFKLLPDNVFNVSSFEVQIDELNVDWDAGNLAARPDLLQGLLQVKNLNVLGEQLGDYQLRIDSKDQQLNGVFTEKKAQIKANLNVTLSLSNQLKIEGDIKANNKEMQSLLNSANVKDKVLFNYQL